MKSPTGVMKEDWSLAGHLLPEVYEEQEDPDAFCMSSRMARLTSAPMPSGTP